MKPGGVIAFHVTNRYLNLPPVVRQVAEQAGYQSVLIADEAADDTRGLLALSDWVLVTKNEKFLNAKIIQERKYPFETIPGLQLWTDDFNNLFKVLK
jgi:hypothetical protein